MSSTDRHRCAVCDLAIRPGLLMCGGHWRRVPAPLQLAVLRTYGRWARHTGSARDALPLLAAYHAARLQAIEAVERTLNPELTGEKQ